MRKLAVGLFCLIVASCAAPPPPEFGIYTAAFDEAEVATEAVLDVFSPIERAIRKPTPDTFSPDDAAFIADGGRAGNSALIARGFRVAASYNEILVRYAGGESIETLQPAADALVAQVSGLGAAVGLPGAGIVAGPAIEGVKVLAGALLAAADRAEFARSVAANAGQVDDFLEAVRAFTPDMYAAAVAHIQGRVAELGIQGRIEEARAVQGDQETFRQLLANWVLVIDDTRAALAALESAVAAGEAAGPTLAGVAFWTGEITRHAEAAKFAARNISNAF